MWSHWCSRCPVHLHLLHWCFKCGQSLHQWRSPQQKHEDGGSFCTVGLDGWRFSSGGCLQCYRHFCGGFFTAFRQTFSLVKTWQSAFVVRKSTQSVIMSSKHTWSPSWLSFCRIRAHRGLSASDFNTESRMSASNHSLVSSSNLNLFSATLDQLTRCMNSSPCPD